MTDFAVQGPTYAEAMKQLGAPSQLMKIVDVLKGYNNLMQEAPFFPSNALWANKTVQNAQEPTGQFRGFYQGITQETDYNIVVEDVIANLESFNNVDKGMADSMPGGPDAYRSQRDITHVRGMTKTMERVAFEGNWYTDPQQYNGLAVRLSDLGHTMVVGAGGTGSDLCSIYVVNWGMGGAYFGYPPGTMGGLEMVNMGVQVVPDPNVTNGFYRAYQTWFRWACGLIVESPRAIGRVANIESGGGANSFDEDDLIDLLVQMDIGPGAMIYLNRTVMAQAWKRVKDKTNTNFAPSNTLDAGGPPMTFNGIPVRMSDQLDTDEGAVTDI